MLQLDIAITNDGSEHHVEILRACGVEDSWHITTNSITPVHAVIVTPQWLCAALVGLICPAFSFP